MLSKNRKLCHYLKIVLGLKSKGVRILSYIAVPEPYKCILMVLPIHIDAISTCMRLYHFVLKGSHRSI